MSQPSARLGSLLKDGREAKGLTLLELGKKIDQSPQHIWDVENGVRPFPAAKIVPWARALGILPDLIYIHLLTQEGERLKRLSGLKLDYTVTPRRL